MTKDADTVIVETDIDAAPDQVWRALSEQELLEAWLLPSDAGREADDGFAFDDEGRRIDCEVVEAEPSRRLRWRWREADAGTESEVVFTLTPTREGGTHVRIAHGPIVVSLGEARARREARLSGLAPCSTLSLARAA
jgi:uncharacterized protein YndB with AHSA1/START domain